jgi:hypothetical protein
MAQKLRATREITDKDFDRLTELVLQQDEELLEMLARV